MPGCIKKNLISVHVAVPENEDHYNDQENKAVDETLSIFIKPGQREL